MSSSRFVFLLLVDTFPSHKATTMHRQAHRVVSLCFFCFLSTLSHHTKQPPCTAKPIVSSRFVFFASCRHFPITQSNHHAYAPPSPCTKSCSITLTMPRARREPRRSDVASTNMTRSRAQEKDIVLHFLVTQAATE